MGLDTHPHERIVFPDGMGIGVLLEDLDKFMYAKYGDSKKPYYQTWVQLRTNIAEFFSLKDSSNLSAGDIEAWQSSLKVAFKTDELFDLTTGNASTVTNNGYYQTGSSTSSIPQPQSGILLNTNYGSNKFQIFRTIESDSPSNYYRIYNGSAWSLWSKVETPDLSSYLKIDGSNLSTNETVKETWLVWIVSFLGGAELSDLNLTGLEEAKTPAEKQTWWGILSKSIKENITTLIDRVYSIYVTVTELNTVKSNYTDGLWWTVADYAARQNIPLSKRREGSAVTYRDANDRMITQRYQGSDLEDINWNDDSNWQNIITIGNNTDIRELYDSTGFDFSTLNYNNDGVLSDETPSVFCMIGFDSNHQYTNNGSGKFYRTDLVKTSTSAPW